MPTTSLYWDIENARLLQNDRLNAEREMPPGVIYDLWQLDVYPLIPYPAGGGRQQLQAFDVTDHTLQLYIGDLGAATQLAAQIAWTRDEVNNKFSATVSLYTAQLITAFAATTKAYIDTYIQLSLTGAGEPRSIIRPIRIKRSVWTPAVLDPTVYETPTALSDALELILLDSDTVDVERIANTFKFNVRRKAGGRIGADTDGLYLEELEPAPDSFLDQIRLESPFAAGSTVNAENANNSTTAAAGGTGTQVYLTRLRVRAAVELRTYADGLNIGHAYWHPTAPAGPRNVWKLAIADPPQTIYLNFDQTGGVTDHDVLDYVLPPLRIAAGADVTLSYDTFDGQQSEVDADLVPNVTAPAASNTPFVQIDQVPLDFELNDNTSYQALAIADAGTSDVNIAKGVDSHTVKATVTADEYTTAFTHKIVLHTVHPDAGDIIELRLSMPAAVAPTLEVRNAVDTGTVLHTILGEIAAQEILLRYVFNGTAWEELFNSSADDIQGNIFSQADIDFASTQEVDLNDAAIQKIALTDDVTLATLSASRGTATKAAKNVSLLLTASGGTRAIALAAGANLVGDIVASLEDGQSCWVNITSLGADETDSYFAFGAIS